MLTLKLPDGTNKQFPPKTTPRQVAESIGKRLAQAAIAAKFDGEIVDLDRELPPADALAAWPDQRRSAGAKPQAAPEHSFQVLTEKDADALEVLRHSCAHVMARAVMRLFPGAQLAFGPPVENGFYYDIDVEPPIKEEDFPRIEAEMKKIVDKAEPFERFERPVTEARALCNDLAQAYKVEHIDDDLKQYPILSFYRQGEFIDLCRGPHLPHAGKIGAFKLLSIAGAYWKKDTTRKQLQRLYATAFFSQKDLDAYLHKIEEAKKRDHRVLGKQLKLFTISPLVGSGLILWMPRGAIVRGLLETFIKDELVKRGYQPVYTPHIGRLELYRTSGHFPYYRDAQFPPIYMRPAAGVLDLIQWRLAKGELDDTEEADGRRVSEVRRRCVCRATRKPSPKEKLEIVHRRGQGHAERAGGASCPITTRPSPPRNGPTPCSAGSRSRKAILLKPMNCPHHIQIYKAEQRSYRDLPIRLAEFGTVYRFEQTGELNGMTRVRGFTQDDAHLFIRPDQIEVEMKTVATMAEGHVKGVQGMMRHSRFSTTKVYMQILKPEVRSTVDSIHKELPRKTVPRLLRSRRWQLFQSPDGPTVEEAPSGRQQHSRSTLRMRLPQYLRNRFVVWFWNLRQRCDKAAEGRWR